MTDVNTDADGVSIPADEAALLWHLGFTHGVDTTGMSLEEAAAAHRRGHVDRVGVRRHHPPADLHPWADGIDPAGAAR